MAKGTIPKATFRTNFYRFKKNGDLQRFKKGDKNIYQITNKSRVKVLKYNIIKNKKIWDKKWRIVIFDIPFNKKNARDFLRNRLRFLGFKQLQKSVWIHPFDVFEEVKVFLNLYHLSNCVRFIVVEDIDNDKDIRKWFFEDFFNI